MPWRWAMQAAVHHGEPARGVANVLILWRKKAAQAVPSGGSREGAYQGMGLGPWQGAVIKGTEIRGNAGPRRDGLQRVWLSSRAAVQARAWVWA